MRVKAQVKDVFMSCKKSVRCHYNKILVWFARAKFADQNTGEVRVLLLVCDMGCKWVEIETAIPATERHRIG